MGEDVESKDQAAVEEAGAADGASEAEAPLPGGAAPPPPPASEKLDPQLIVLAVILWVVAGGIFLFQQERLRVDWHLGNIMESLEAQGAPDEASIDALVSMAADGVEVSDYLRQELDNPAIGATQSQQVYRAVMVALARKVPGPRAFELLQRAAGDYDPRVRANAYLALWERAATPEEQRAALDTLTAALGADPEPQARAIAARALGETKQAAQVGWPLLRTLRDLDPAAEGVAPVRSACAQALYAVSGKSEDELPLDLSAERDVRQAQLEAWGAWYRESGGQLPEGEALTLPPAQVEPGAAAGPGDTVGDTPGAAAPEAPPPTGSRAE